MDRRTVLAFVLIFLILIGSQIVMEKIYGPSRRAAATDSTAVMARDSATGVNSGVSGGVIGGEDTALRRQTSRIEAPEGAALDQSSDPTDRAYRSEQDEFALGDEMPRTALEAMTLRDQAGPAQIVTVDTPYYVVGMSSRGARIVSFVLKKFDHFEGGNVQLVPTGEQAALAGADAISFRGGRLELAEAYFQYDGLARLYLNEGAEPVDVVFHVITAGGARIAKTYTFAAEGYGVLAGLSLSPDDAERWASGQSLLGEPRRAVFGWNQGISDTERVARNEAATFRAFAQVGDELHVRKRSGLAKNVEKVTGEFSGSVRFAGVQNKYFTVSGIVLPASESAVEGTILLSGDQARNQQTWLIEVPLRQMLGGSGDNRARAEIELYLGPQDRERLASYGVGLENSVDLGFKLIRPLAEGVLWILGMMTRVIPNYGFVIILFSALTKLMFYPLTRKSTQSMKRMQDLQPKIKAMQEKYKDNKEKQSQAMMELYREEKINPMAGCLPLVVQMPVFFALYQALMHTIDLRNTPFVGWITDLSQPDALFTLPFALPFLGSDFNLLPILMTALMVVQTKLTPTAAAGGQMAAMNTVLPVVMLFIFYQMPSGLVLYWLVNTVMTIYQSWRIHKAAPAPGGA